MARRSLNRLFWAALDRFFLVLARLNVRFALVTAYRAATAANRLGLYGFTPAQFANLLGTGEPRALAPSARAASGGVLVARVLPRIRWRRRSLAPIADNRASARLATILERGRGAILVLTHASIVLGLDGWLEAAGHDYRAFRVLVPGHIGRRLVFSISSALPTRLSALKGAIDQLRRGGIVLMAADAGIGTSWVEATFLGRRVDFLRGAPAIARATGAPLHPTVPFWDQTAGLLRVEIFDEVDTSDLDRSDPETFDDAVLQRLAEQFSNAFRQHPEALIRDITSARRDHRSPRVPAR